MNKTNLENLKYSGAVDLEKIPCPLCGGIDFKVLVVEQTIPVVRCRGCGFAFANPRPDKRGLLRFYENYFPPESESLWQEQMAQVFLTEGFEKIQEFIQRGLFQPSAPPKVLDIGCGMGFFLDLMKKKGWQVKGIEPAPPAVKHAREKLGIEVLQGTVEDAGLGRDYDAVTLWYVMEHVPNPVEILECAGRALKKGGLVIIRVPNQNAWIDQVLGALGLGRFFLMNPPRHLFDYSPKTLSRLLEKCGFEVMEIKNSIPRGTGTPLELLRRYLWYGTFQAIYYLSFGKILRGSSMTVYAKKK